MEDFLGFVFILIGLYFAVAGIAFVVSDYRHYGIIYTQCKEKGFIQDKATKIKCSVDY